MVGQNSADGRGVPSWGRAFDLLLSGDVRLAWGLLLLAWGIVFVAGLSSGLVGFRATHFPRRLWVTSPRRFLALADPAFFVVRRNHTPSCRRVSIQRAQRTVPSSLPSPVQLSDPALSPWDPSDVGTWCPPWTLLSWLLLVADARHVFRGCNAPYRDAVIDRSDGD
jgi:hypothetical protein